MNKRLNSSIALSTRFAELGAAAPQVVAHRVARMALAGSALSPRDRKEFTGMVVEKQVAAAQAWNNMLVESLRIQQRLMLSMLTAFSPQQQAARATSAALGLMSAGLRPVHRKAVGNAKRLGRTKLR